MAEHQLPEADILAYQMSEAAADQEGDEERAQAYLREFLDELMTLEPAVRQHFTDVVIGELKEEITRREDSRHAHAAVTLIEEIARSWKERG